MTQWSCRVRTHEDFEEGEPRAWSLRFRSGSAGNPLTEFEAGEPYLVTETEWRRLAEPRSEFGHTIPTQVLGLYCGNGRGEIVAQGTDIIFRAEPRGGGGDVMLTVRVDHADVGPALSIALDEASKRIEAGELVPFASSRSKERNK